MKKVQSVRCWDSTQKEFYTKYISDQMYKGEVITEFDDTEKLLTVYLADDEDTQKYNSNTTISRHIAGAEASWKVISNLKQLGAIGNGLTVNDLLEFTR